jgi:hypothetical protein
MLLDVHLVSEERLKEMNLFEGRRILVESTPGETHYMLLEQAEEIARKMLRLVKIAREEGQPEPQPDQPPLPIIKEYVNQDEKGLRFVLRYDAYPRYLAHFLKLYEEALTDFADLTPDQVEACIYSDDTHRYQRGIEFVLHVSPRVAYDRGYKNIPYSTSKF